MATKKKSGKKGPVINANGINNNRYDKKEIILL